MTSGPDSESAEGPIHHVPHTPVVLALGVSAVLCWLYVAYEQVSTSGGLVGLALAASTIVMFFVLRRAPGPRVLALMALTVAQIGWFLIALG